MVCRATRGISVLAQAWPLLTDIEAQLAAMDEAGIDAKVLSAPASVLKTSSQQLSNTLIERINDRLAALVAAHPKRLLALATIDAFGGVAAVRAMERAALMLGIGGICVDCTQEDRYLDAPEVRPVLEAATALDLVVFVHPVSPPGLTERLARLGHIGMLLARGTENAASLDGALTAPPPLMHHPPFPLMYTTPTTPPHDAHKGHHYIKCMMLVVGIRSLAYNQAGFRMSFK